MNRQPSNSTGSELNRTLSIIIPALDEERHIGPTLAALADARGRGAEVIVVDGGSRDRTRERAAALADRVLEAARGRAVQLNAGAGAARGEVLVFLHADSILPPGFDQLIRSAAAQRELAWGRFDVRIDGDHRSLPIVAALMNLRSRLTGIATGDQTLFATRALFDRAGRFPVQALMEDIEFCRNARRLAPPACLRAKVRTSGRRWTRRGVLRTILLMWRLRLAYFLGADPVRLAARYHDVR